MKYCDDTWRTEELSDSASKATGFDIRVSIYDKSYHVFADDKHLFAGSEGECRTFMEGMIEATKLEEYALPDEDVIYREVEKAWANGFYTLHDIIHHNTYVKDMADSLGCRATHLLEEKIMDAQVVLLKKYLEAKNKLK